MPRRSSRTPGRPHREALDVRLVDHRLVPRRAAAGGRPPSRSAGRSRRTSGSRRRRPRRRARGRRPPRRSARTAARCRRRSGSGPRSTSRTGRSAACRVEAVALGRRVRAVDAVAVALARPDQRQVAVPVVARCARSARCAPRCRRRRTGTARRASAFSENSEKFVPPPSHVAPSGNGSPGQISLIAPPPRRAGRARRRARSPAASTGSPSSGHGASPKLARIRYGPRRTVRRRPSRSARAPPRRPARARSASAARVERRAARPARPRG